MNRKQVKVYKYDVHSTLTLKTYKPTKKKQNIKNEKKKIKKIKIQIKKISKPGRHVEIREPSMYVSMLSLYSNSHKK